MSCLCVRFIFVRFMCLRFVCVRFIMGGVVLEMAFLTAVTVATETSAVLL